ncbi:CBM35 domain-containing protein [Streptomyces sp. B21-105]|uniref:CBM35 domain-containing protein n=1 Tax=Streptomyces sp. B21-105 TaxID=3039417 RepID=UPI002FF32355
MTPGNNGASTPEDDDPFGYLYADGQANGAQPPSGGGYGYPNSVNRVRAVGERQYGQQQPQRQQQTAQYGQPSGQYGQPSAVPQQGPYGQPNAHYAAPENFAGGGPSTGRQPVQGGGGRGGGPNTKGLLIGAVAVVAAVVIGIAVAMANGDKGTDDDKAGGGASAPASAPASPSPSTSSTGDANEAELPAVDAKAVSLTGTTTASDVKGAKADGGIYVTGFNTVGAAITWNVSSIPKDGKYTLDVNYGVPGKDAKATLTVNGTVQTRPLNLGNFAHAAEGDYAKGWTNTWANITLNKGTNTIKISCEQGNSCDVNFDQLSLEAGWRS